VPSQLTYDDDNVKAERKAVAMTKASAKEIELLLLENYYLRSKSE
jgi:hypothetical protein